MLKLRQFLLFVNCACVTNALSVIQCGDNEVYDICPPKYPSCLSNSEAGITACTPGCRCLDNYLRNEYGLCVPTDQLECHGQNEVSGCQNNCFPQTCHSIGKTHHCPLENSDCKPECRCKENYFRNYVGDCISKEDCLQCTGQNEYLSTVGPCDNFCDSPNKGNQTNSPNIEVLCINMCHCEEGYARNSNNACVLMSECSPQLQCGRNEVSSCHSTCPQTCESIGKRYFCPLQRPGCEPECRCKTDYYRNKIGECISKDDCLKCSGPNEYFSSNGKCDKFCASLHQGIESFPLDNRVCGNICHCEEGYARDFNNSCVPISKCPKLICSGQNEVSGCYIPCPPQTCESLTGIAIPCVPPPINCQPECRCKDGYYRNKIGECISKEECLICPGPNEYYSSAEPCDQSCDSLSKKNLPYVDVICINMCHCEEGYVRDSNYNCVPKSECLPRLNCNGQNEVSGCHSTCPQTCESIGKAYSCPLQPAGCEPECRCKADYFRNKIGDCISKEDCLKCSGPNEYFSTNGKCDSFCASLNQNKGTENKECGNICHCEEGYARDFNNTCVPVSQCPKLECLGQNEVSGCYIPCPPQTCESLTGIPLPCVPPPINCQPECRCKDGYYRNKIGECISQEDCSQCTGPNEYFSSAGPCDKFCNTPDPDSNVECINMCHCEKGYVRNANNTCVPISECSPRLLNCEGQNQVSGCHSTCPQTCESIGKAYSCPLQPAGCEPECRCKADYFRNKIGECISEEDCLKCTGPNEYFTSNGACDKFCATLNQGDGSSPSADDTVCGSECHCEEGYARDFNNTCVPISVCPKLNCSGENEVSACRVSCPAQTCESISTENVRGKCIPPPTNCLAECRCKNNYYRNKIGECISREDCLKCNGPNEYFSSNGACDSYCASLNSEDGSSYSDDNRRCGNICHCEEGYARDFNNTCVPVSECPKLKCSGENEVSGCYIPCPPQTCESLTGIALPCVPPPINCQPECRCKNGYYRNKIRECISKEDCSKCTGPNEYFSYNDACDKVCASSKQNKKNPVRNMCHCEDGYARSSNYTCIPTSQCPQDNTDLEEFEQGNIAFTQKLLYMIAKRNPGVSFIFSALSALILVAQLALYAEGQSLLQLLRLLNLHSNTQIRSFMPSFLDTLNSEHNVTFDIVSSAYANIDYTYRPSFKMDLKNIFNAEAKNLDFCKNAESAEIINHWVANKTNNLITSLIPPNVLDCNTAFVLINAIYFKDDWKYKFDPKNTQKAKFFVNKDKYVTVNMMKQTGRFKYADIEELGVQVLILPYKNEAFSLMMLLPKIKYGIDGLIDKINRRSFSISKIVNNTKYAMVKVNIPIITTTTTTNLKDVFTKNNVTAIFNSKTSGLTNILDEPKPIEVSYAIQKATIILSESGTEAAAVSGVVGRTFALPLPVEYIEFIADHQFVYFVLYHNDPIFAGIYAGP